MPVMGITAVGKDMVRDAKYFRLACRIIAELGAQYVKTYYVEEGFETVTASCPVPIVMAGGKKLPELEALTMAYNAVQQGAAGVDMGRNIFQSDAPKAMIAAVAAVVHKSMKPRRGARPLQVAQGEEVGWVKRSADPTLTATKIALGYGLRPKQPMSGPHSSSEKPTNSIHNHDYEGQHEHDPDHPQQQFSSHRKIKSSESSPVRVDESSTAIGGERSDIDQRPLDRPHKRQEEAREPTTK